MPAPHPTTLCRSPQPKTVCGRPQPKTVCGRPQPKTVCVRPQPKTVCVRPQPKTVCRPQPKTVCGRPQPKTVCGQPQPKTVCGQPQPKTVWMSRPRVRLQPKTVCRTPRPHVRPQPKTVCRRFRNHSDGSVKTTAPHEDSGGAVRNQTGRRDSERESGSLVSEQAMLRKGLSKAARAELTGKPRSRESMGRRGARTESKPRLRFRRQESARGMPAFSKSAISLIWQQFRVTTGLRTIEVSR
jgi:hypothetical protein